MFSWVRNTVLDFYVFDVSLFFVWLLFTFYKSLIFFCVTCTQLNVTGLRVRSYLHRRVCGRALRSYY